MHAVAAAARVVIRAVAMEAEVYTNQVPRKYYYN